jgi:hypothetical protein
MEGSSLITPRKFRANPGILALNLEKPKNYFTLQDIKIITCCSQKHLVTIEFTQSPHNQPLKLPQTQDPSSLKS